MSKRDELTVHWVRITGCMSRRDAIKAWHEIATTYARAGLPMRCGMERYGKGYALYRVPFDKSA